MITNLFDAEKTFYTGVRTAEVNTATPWKYKAYHPELPHLPTAYGVTRSAAREVLWSTHLTWLIAEQRRDKA